MPWLPTGPCRVSLEGGARTGQCLGHEGTGGGKSAGRGSTERPDPQSRGDEKINWRSELEGSLHIMGSGQEPTLQHQSGGDSGLDGREWREEVRVGFLPREKTDTHGATRRPGDKIHPRIVWEMRMRELEEGWTTAFTDRSRLDDKAAGGFCANPNRLDKDRQPDLSGEQCLGAKATHFDGGLLSRWKDSDTKTRAW